MLRGIRPGELDQRLTIWSVSTSRESGTNQEIRSHSILTTVSAKQLSVTNRSNDLIDGGSKSNERYEAQQVVAVDLVRFFMRWSTTVSSVTEKMMMSIGAKVYEVSGKEDPGRRMGYIILSGELRNNLSVTADRTDITADSTYITGDSL